MGLEVFVAATGLGAVFVAAVSILVTLKGIRDQLWLHMFSEYTKRYSEIVKSLPSESRRPGSDFRFEELSHEAQGEMLNVVRAYLNLCSEEYYLHRRGRIDRETWALWRLGMEETFRLPWMRQTWKLVRAEYVFFEEFNQFIDDCIAGREPVRASDADLRRVKDLAREEVRT
jgi:hypothetical protein